MPDLPGVRYEIIDGDLYVSRQPQLAHQYASDEIQWALRSWSKETGLGRAVTVPGLVFADDNDVIPDVVWISQARLPMAVDEKGHLRIAPELVIEVLSPGRANEVRDRELKLGLYSRQGVQEYWIVDWQRRSVDIFRREGEGLVQAATLRDDDVLSSPLLPEFRCPVASLWDPALSQ
jgi:Uma2 family endonuclease